MVRKKRKVASSIEECISRHLKFLWKKNKKDVTEEDLNKFYKDNFSDYEDPLLSLNLNLEGVVSFNSLVFIPSHAPYDLYSQNYEKGLKLYIKGIFIKEKAKELVPDYLKFIKGLVDTNDLSFLENKNQFTTLRNAYRETSALFHLYF